MAPNIKVGLADYVSSFIQYHNLKELSGMKTNWKWEKYGDMIIIDCRTLNRHFLYMPVEFWTGVCETLKGRRLCLRNGVCADGFRTPNIKMVVGNDGWVLHRDNHIRYSWDVCKSMFSAGNAPEKHRIAGLDCRGQVVVDMFAGIGYFTLPYLVHAQAANMFALDWNPNALEALRRNLRLNKVEDRCCVLEGDNRSTCPVGVADRVNLGLIPSSEEAWTTACRALRPQGGVLTIHGNVQTLRAFPKCPRCPAELVKTDVVWKQENWGHWVRHVLHSIQDILLSLHQQRYTTRMHVFHCVKSYAPHVHHVVVDVAVSTSQEQ